MNSVSLSNTPRFSSAVASILEKYRPARGTLKTEPECPVSAGVPSLENRKPPIVSLERVHLKLRRRAMSTHLDLAGRIELHASLTAGETQTAVAMRFGVAPGGPAAGTGGQRS
jgi:hypothetical protein